MVAGIAASCLTHPIAWWANETIGRSLSRWARLGVIEVSVSVLEGLLYVFVLPMTIRRGLTLGFLANATSFGVGILVFMWLRS